MQRQLNKGKCRSNKVVKSPRLHIEHFNLHDKTIQTRTFGIGVSMVGEYVGIRVAVTVGLEVVGLVVGWETKWNERRTYHMSK